MNVETLLKTNVAARTEKKGKLTYLSWAWAWDFALRADPAAIYEIKLFDGKPFVDINGTAMVMVTVTIFGKAITCQLPVMNNYNKAIIKPDAFEVNTAIMRCMTKGLALHGLGLGIYVGEDLQDYVKPKGDGPIITPKGDIGEDLPQEDKEFLLEMAASCEELVKNNKAKEASQMLSEAMLDDDQKVWLWGRMTSQTRAAITKAKG